MPVLSPCICNQLMNLSSILQTPYLTCTLTRTRGRSRNIRRLCWDIRCFQEDHVLRVNASTTNQNTGPWACWRFLSNMIQAGSRAPGSGIRARSVSIEDCWLPRR
ncbi:hypothetical protein F5Y02DRAFT_284729 [Annulohypoxylon stygium]|nr:hypothetical protein F5Y02DRAFT_284729 [Annulohypoxylon stygium]